MKDSLVVYEEDWIIRIIYETSDKIRESAIDQTHFEERCIKRIARYLKEDRNRLKNKRYIKSMVKKEASDYIKWCRKEEASMFSEIDLTDDEEDLEFDPMDVLADVESEVIAKEMTALLAQGDHLLEEIVGYWAIGNTNNASISRSLARTFGGNAESHRRRINRFRHDCRKHLSAAV